jgi:amino acid adenylation domain-containing protein
MNDLRRRITNFFPEKLALLENFFQNKNTSGIKKRVVPQREEMDNCPLSFAQERLWFFDQLEPGSSVYNMRLALRLVGHLNVAALEQSISEIIRRHEVLRTIFPVVDDRPVQKINPDAAFTLQQVDISTMPEEQRETEVRRLVSEEASRPFDLARGPLLRAVLIRLKLDEHVLLLTMHHIVSDGWSIAILYRELSVLYEAFSKGNQSPFPDLSIQYTDFTVWQRRWLQREKLEEQLMFWKEQLRGIDILDLPTDHPRPAVQRFRGARHTLQFPQRMTKALQDLSRKERVTLFMTLLAGFQSLLRRYTGQDDIVVGIPIANRNRPEIEGLIGFFVNTLVMRIDTSGNPVFRELLKRVRKSALDAYEHQDLPFEKLVEELQPERNLSHSPLFKVMFVLQNAPRYDVEFSGLKVNRMNVNSESTLLDLVLSVQENAEGLKATFTYNTDLFDASTIERMAGHYQRLLEGIVSNPDKRLSELQLLTEAERHQMVVEWNSTETYYPRDKCIHELFEEQVRRSPDATAVIFEDQQLTYRELNNKANQLAHYLMKQGVGPEVLVGICVERSPEMVTGILGILKAGGAYVPLDPAYPMERIKFMLKDANPSLLLAQKHLCEKLTNHKSRIILLDTDWHTIAHENKTDLMSGVQAENLAYVIYTSGSTGHPKGVMISHISVCNRLLWGLKSCQMTEADRVLQKAFFSFDVSVWEIFGPLLAGAQVILAQTGREHDCAYLVRLIADRQITMVGLMPPLLKVFLQEEGLERCQSLRQVFCGGEVLSVELKEKFFTVMTGELHHLYGPTEASIDATFWTCSPGRDERMVPIGRPIANIKIYLLDPNLQPVPIGIPGELYIGGDGLARGYLNQPDLTAKTFIPDPFTKKPGARLYRTGDLCRYLPDGNIEFLGRIDHQVKIRGFRIEPGEIEAALGQHADVRETVVTAQEIHDSDKRLVAYVVLDGESAITTHELRMFLKEKLPDYMVPSAFIELDSLPLTPNGKVDQKALPEPDKERADLENVFVEPRTPNENLLAGIWCEVLGLKQVGIHDNFFESGGHSLLATQVMSRLRKVKGKNFSLAILFQYPTIAGLAEYLSRENGPPQSADQDFYTLFPIQTSGARTPFFWIHSQMITFLPKYLGGDQPLYAIIAQGVDGKRVRYKTMKEITAHYLREIRAVQPSGPYFLGGFCWGAKYALDIAQQLIHSGEDIGLLFVVEPALSCAQSDKTFIDKIYPPFSRHRRNLAGRPHLEKIRYVTGLFLPRLKRPFFRMVNEAYLLTGRPMSPLRSVYYALDVIMKTYPEFVQKTYPKEIVLIQAETGNHPVDSDWSNLAEGGATVHVAQGSTHMDLLEEPGAGFWAEWLNRYLRKAQSNYSGMKDDTERSAYSELSHD